MTFDPAPADLDTVRDPAWLTAILSRNWPGVRVREVTTVELLATQATKVRLALKLDGADAPTDICIKGVLTATGAPKSASITETRFYRDLAASLPVRTPPLVYAELNEAGDNGVLVMRDVITPGGRFFSALQPCTPEEAQDGLDQLAALHAAAWQGSAAYDTPWIPRFLDMVGSRGIMPIPTLQELLDGPRGVPLAPAMRDAARLQRAMAQLAAQVREAPNCLVHGDAHAGNVYRDVDGGLGLVDWQVLQKGEWAQDVAYHIAAVLTPEARRTHERALLDHYRARLKALGGPDLDADKAWARYRVGMCWGYYMWAITRKVEPNVIHEFVRRLGFAVADHESYAALGV